MITAYNFNSHYRPDHQGRMPSLRLLEGGRFNPGDFAPCLIHEEDNFRLRYFKWGLALYGDRDSLPAELDFTLPAQKLVRHLQIKPKAEISRCIIPSDAFYAERKINGLQRQLKFDLRDKQTFCFAGLYKKVIMDDGSWGQAFVMLTIKNHETGGIEPFVIRREWEHLWLSPHTDATRITHLINHPGNGLLTAHPVRELLIASSGYRKPVAA